MKRVAIFAALLLAGCATAPPEEVAKAEANVATLWARMKHAGSPPTVVVVPRDQIAYHGQFSDGNSFASYLCVRRTMTLPMGVDWGTIVNESVIIHELTHHHQCLRGATPTVGGSSRQELCAREAEAYTVQHSFLFDAERAAGAKWSAAQHAASAKYRQVIARRIAEQNACAADQ